MKLTIQKTALAQALAAVSSITSSKVDLPILKFAKLETDGKNISITGTSLDCSYKRTIRSEINLDKAACLIPVAKIKDWLASVVCDEVNIDAAPDVVKLSADDSGLSRFATLYVDEFPPTPKTPEKSTLTADFAPLKHVAWSVMDPTGAKPALEAAFIEHEGGGIVAATSDGRKLGVVKIPGKINDEAFKTSPIALPAKYIGLVAGLGECSLIDSKSDLHFVGDFFHISIRKSEHGIPNWRRMKSSKEFPVIGSITVMREELAQSVSLCHLLKGSAIGLEHGVALSLSKTKTGLNITCFVAKTAESHTRDIDGRIRGEFPTVRLSTEHISPFFHLQDDSPLKIEFTGDKTMVHMSAPELGVDMYFCPLFPEKEEK